MGACVCWCQFSLSAYIRRTRYHITLLIWSYCLYLSFIFIPHHTTVAGYYDFTLDVRVYSSVRQLCVRPSVFRFRVITWVNINGFLPNLVCALILWRSCLGLLIGKCHQILTELFARDATIFSFPDDNLIKRQGILTKLGTCIDSKDIWFGIANWQITSMFWQLSSRDTIIAGYYRFMFLFINVKEALLILKLIILNFVTCLLLKRNPLKSC